MRTNLPEQDVNTQSDDLDLFEEEIDDVNVMMVSCKVSNKNRTQLSIMAMCIILQYYNEFKKITGR